MFIRTKHYIDAVKAAASAQQEVADLRSQRATMQTTIDWMRVRVNQLEKERAILFREVTKLNIPTIELAQQSMTPVVPPSMQMPNFEDLGDDAALKLGISHDPNGELLFDEQ